MVWDIACLWRCVRVARVACDLQHKFTYGGTGMDVEPKLAYTSSQLRKLASDLDDMQEYLGEQVKRMDEIVDGIETGWRGPTATAYRSLHRGAAEDAVRIGQNIQFLAEAIRLSEGGFTNQELETLEQFRRVQADVDVEAAADALSTPTTQAPRSRLQDF